MLEMCVYIYIHTSKLPHIQIIYLIITFITYSGFCSGRTYVELAP